uniref:TSA: Wollemia nobilis Ref_Wollemi_Transcript_12761_3126 transcribed RNA sequence n=1 Tax=Wollemia nobilis TaxID=56998 RepID=A0A0C9RL59_9CONI
MTCISTYLALTGRPWGLVFAVVGLFWRIVSLLCQIPWVRRDDDSESGVELKDERDLDGHALDWGPREAARPIEERWCQNPMQIQKSTWQSQKSVTEFHDCKELVSQVHECMVVSEEGDEKGDLGCPMDVAEQSMDGSSEAIVNKAKNGVALEEVEEIREKEDHEGPREDASIAGDGDVLFPKEKGPEIESVAEDVFCNGGSSHDPWAETVQSASDTEEEEEIQSLEWTDEEQEDVRSHGVLHNHAEWTEGEQEEIQSHVEWTDEGTNPIGDEDALHKLRNFETGGYAVQYLTDTEDQHEEMQRISSEEAHMEFFDETPHTEEEQHDEIQRNPSKEAHMGCFQGEYTSVTRDGDALIQDGEFKSKGVTGLGFDGCNDIAEISCSEPVRMVEADEYGLGYSQAAGKEQNCEAGANGNESYLYEDDDDWDDEEHDFFIQKLKSEIRRLKGPNLSVIPEESESDLFDSSTVWDSESEEESSTSNPTQECPSVFRTLEPPEEEDTIEAFYDKYTERMLYFDRLNYQQIYKMGLLKINHETLKPCKPQGVAKRLKKCISNKHQAKDGDGSHDLMMQFQQCIETVYVGQTCLSWEALHWQYKMFQEMVLSGSDHNIYYDYVADRFQQFQVLLHRFLENEPFEGPRVQNYVKNRCVWRSFLQVPAIKGSAKAEEVSGPGSATITAKQLVNLMEESIVIFSDFVRADKEKPTMQNQLLNFLCGPQELEDLSDVPLLNAVKNQLHFKELKVRELQRRGRCIIKRLDPRTGEGLEILMALVDIKLVYRVLKMSRITSDHLQWCQKKLNKLHVSHGKVQRGRSTLLFPQ